jgi:8-oxo-dGTP pyrophosphatase MutT (NUDIX family)
MQYRKPPRRATPEHKGHAPTREDSQDFIEVHVAGACVRYRKGRWKLLAAKRTDRRSLFPGKWECGGGQVRKGESFEMAVRRQIFEEFGLDVEVYLVLRPYEIHIPRGQGLIPGMRFLCLAHEGRVRLNRKEFAEFRWVDINPVPKLDWIGGVKEVLDTITPEMLPNMAGRTIGADAIGQQLPAPEKRPPGFAPYPREVKVS